MTTKVAVDASFPSTVETRIDATGVTFMRIKGSHSDLQAVRWAASLGASAFVTIGRSSFLDHQLRDEAHALGVTLIAAVDEDPFEAEQHLVAATGAIATVVSDPTRVDFYWLKKHGLDPAG